MFTDKSDVRCLGCNVRFSNCDVSILEDGQSPVCDLCCLDMCKATVDYDGSKDLLEHLENEMERSRCMFCYEKNTYLDHLSYRSPVSAFIKCRDCDNTYIFEVKINFID